MHLRVYFPHYLYYSSKYICLRVSLRFKSKDCIFITAMARLSHMGRFNDVTREKICNKSQHIWMHQPRGEKPKEWAKENICKLCLFRTIRIQYYINWIAQYPFVSIWLCKRCSSSDVDTYIVLLGSLNRKVINRDINGWVLMERADRVQSWTGLLKYFSGNLFHTDSNLRCWRNVLA